MVKHIFLSNQNSRSNNDHRLLAAVGNNGINDHYSYGVGYDFAVKALIQEAADNSKPIDAIIYPLLFCIRHRIELFLKDQIIQFTKIKENTAITETNITGTHDLAMLWDKFKNYAEITDKRFLKNIDDMENFIVQFSMVDPTGQTFRYPYDRYKTKHLTDTPLVNVARLADEYKDFTQEIEDFEYLTKDLIIEYATGTFTSDLSREDIQNIAITLPDRRHWTDDTFTQIKSELIEIYGISGNKFTNALNIIQSHREFCSYIGQEMPLEHLSTKELSLYLCEYNKIHPSKEKTQRPIPDRDDHWMKNLSSKISGNAIGSIYTLARSHTASCYSEEFSKLHDEQMEELEEMKEWHLNSYYSRIYSTIVSPVALLRVKKSLTNLGQVTLLMCFTDFELT